jgi:hypothetical protein
MAAADWRRRDGAVMEQLLKGVIATALKVDALKPESIKRVTV